MFIALVEVLPSRVTAAPAGTSGNFALGGFNEDTNSDFVMYQLSGGGYGGNSDHDGHRDQNYRHTRPQIIDT